MRCTFYGMIVFTFVLFMACAKAFGSPILIGGKEVAKKDWPASVYASMSNARCSATVVSERVLLLAAHCVRDGGAASFQIGDAKYASKCAHAPEYVQSAWEDHQEAIYYGTTPSIEFRNSTADWALCLVDKPITDILFEKVAKKQPFKVGDTAWLLGYGCTKPAGTGGNDGILRLGSAKVTGIPSGSNNDTVTYGAAALCYGDSGGGAYDKTTDDRVLFGVNSRGNIRDTSYLSSTSTTTAQAFFKSWSEKYSQAICGLSDLAKNCRGATPMPEREFTVDSEVATIKGTMKPGHEAKLEELKSEIQKLLE